MKLFSKPINLIDFSDIEEFREEEIAENICIDYKQDWSSKDGNQQVAKLACAFSNSLGGIVLFGVKEKKLPDGRGIPEELVGVDEKLQLGKRINQICMNEVMPPVPVETHTVPHGKIAGKEIIIARTPESNWTPHYLRANNRVYVRTGDAAVIANKEGREASPDEIEWLLRRRAVAIEFRDELIRRAESRCPVYDSRKILSASIVPLYPREELWKLSELIPTVKNSGLIYDGDISTANNSVFVSRFDDQPDTWDTFGFFELNKFGLLYYAYEPRELPHAMGTGPVRFHTDGSQFLRCLHLLLTTSKQLYLDKGYWGLVKIQITGSGMRGLKLHIPYTGDYHGGCVDDDFLIEQTVIAANLDADDLIESLYGRFRWCMGLGERSLNSESLKNQLAYVRDGGQSFLQFRFFRRTN